MKFLFFTDTHIRGTTPRSRKDNLYETLKNKFHEVKQISDEHGVDYILHGGDWFDRPDISPAIVREFAMIVKGYERPIYTVAGNHDLFGHNPNTIGRTMLGLLEGIGIMTLIKRDDEIILQKDGVKVQLTGKPYSYDLDGEKYRDYYVVKKLPDVNYAINIVHGMLLNRPFFEGVQYTLLDNITDTEADITLAGHYHSGFGVKVIDSKYFINPGSLVRVSSTLSEIKRKPEVVVIELNETIEIKEIELKSALPGEDVLDRLQLQHHQDREFKLHQFYQGVSTSGEYRRIDLNKMIEEIAANQELSSQVKEEAIRRIAAAKESLSSGEIAQ